MVFAWSGSRSGIPTFSNENEVLFRQNDRKVLRDHCKTQRFQNAIPDLRKMIFSHWESQGNGKSESRSETPLFSNGNGILSWQNYKKGFRITAIYNVFRTRFPTCGKWSSPIGKVKKMESRNRVLKHLCFPMETDHNLGKITKMCSEYIVFYNVFRTRIPIPQNYMITKGFGIPKMHFFLWVPPNLV